MLVRRSRLVRSALPAALAVSLALTGCGSDEPKEANAAQLVQAGLAAISQGNEEAAFAAFTEAAKKQPANVYAHYNLGTMLQKQGKTTEALQEYGLATQANPTYVPALFNAATIYAANNPELAVVTYRRVIKLQPTSPSAYLNLGLLEAQLGLFAEAHRDLATAVKQNPALAKSIPKDVFARELKAGPAPSASPSKP